MGLLFATALGAQTFPLGIVERDTEIVIELPFPQSIPAGAIGSITTDCECLTSLGPPVETIEGQRAKLRFKYRSPDPGVVRVTVWVQDATGDTIGAQYTVKGFVYDKSWVVTPTEVRNDSTVILIDTRWKQQFERVRISRSLNLPAFALKSRSDLRNRRVVLVDGGFAPQDLLEQVQSLRAHGFRDVRYLAGGLPAWLREGGAHEGSAVEPIVAAATISPIDFVRAQVNSAWRLMSLSGDARSAAWPTKDDLQRLREVTRASVRFGMIPSPALAIAENDSSYATVERHLGKSSVHGLFYLAGGAPALASFQRTQQALVNRPTESFQTRIAAPRPLMGSGCGTCPTR